MFSRLVSRCDALLPVITTIIDKSLEAGQLSQVLEGGTSMSVTQKAWSSYHTQEFQTGKQFGFLIEAH